MSDYASTSPPSQILRWSDMFLSPHPFSQRIPIILTQASRYCLLVRIRSTYLWSVSLLFLPLGNLYSYSWFLDFFTCVYLLNIQCCSIILLFFLLYSFWKMHSITESCSNCISNFIKSQWHLTLMSSWISVASEGEALSFRNAGHKKYLSILWEDLFISFQKCVQDVKGLPNILTAFLLNSWLYMVINDPKCCP